MYYCLMETDFFRYRLPYIDSNMYLIMEGQEALIVDPCRSEEALARLRENGVQTVTVLLTHEHFDHTSGVNWLRKHFPCQVICQEDCAARIHIPANNRPLVFLPLMQAAGEEEAAEIEAFYEAFPIESIEADRVFHEVYDFLWQRHRIHMHSCPGHSPGSSVIRFDDTHVFTGDYMIPDTSVILRFPGGSKTAYRQETLPYLLSLDESIKIMPGHGIPCIFCDLRLENGVFRLSQYGKKGA